MAELKLNMQDGVGAEEEIPEGPQIVRREYTVASEAGLFKRGQLYPRGSKVELDPVTAERFINAGDVVDGDLPTGEENVSE